MLRTYGVVAALNLTTSSAGTRPRSFTSMPCALAHSRTSVLSTPSARARRPLRAGRRAPASGVDSTEVREWAKAQGIEVKDRGRVPAELVVKFKAATEN